MLLARFTRFAFVGGVATTIQYLILFVLVQWAKTNPVLASSLGFLVSAFANYVLNYHFTFRSKTQHGSALFKFMAIAGMGLVLNSTIMHVLTSAGFYYLVAQLVATICVLFWSFAGNSLWTFRVNTATTPTANDKQVIVARNSILNDLKLSAFVMRIIVISLAALAL